MLCVPSMALIGLGILTHVTLRIAPWDRTYYNLYFKDEEMEAQGDELSLGQTIKPRDSMFQYYILRY